MSVDGRRTLQQLLDISGEPRLQFSMSNAPTLTRRRRRNGPPPRYGTPLVPCNVALPPSLLEAIDREADARGVSRSQVVRERLSQEEN